MSDATANPPDLRAARRRLRDSQGRVFWRSLEELADSPEFRRYLEAEFPEQAQEMTDEVSRRRFITLMSASLALAGVTSACTRQPRETIVPYVQPPEQFVPGRPIFYATAMPLAGYGIGLLAENHMGRPTKLEGNPDHPASLGATDVFAQASILSLYDPDRSQTITHLGEIRPWADFLAAMRALSDNQAKTKGAGLRILTGTVTSPTLAAQIQTLLQKFPEARWHAWEPCGRHGARAGAKLAFGESVSTHYALEKADVILSLGADFLDSGPGFLRSVREFTRRRRAYDPSVTMNRLYVVETTPSMTGAMADHRMPAKSSEIPNLARAIASRLGVSIGPAPAASAAAAASGGETDRFIAAVVEDLEAHRGSSVVIAGDTQPAEVHALAHALNHALENAGVTAIHTAPVEADPDDHFESLLDLTSGMEAGRVSALIVLGGNPVYTAPADLKFAERMEKVGLRVHLGAYDDETSRLCHWHVPEAHYLESWSDVRAFDGTVSIIQPLIEPLYNGRTSHEIVAALSGTVGRTSHDIVRDHWKAALGAADFDRRWERSLSDGVVSGTALATKTVTPRSDMAEALGRAAGGGARPEAEIAGGETARTPSASPEGGSLEIVFRPDPTVFDGTFSNNGWLQELPKPLTKITWENAFLLSPDTAERLGVAQEDVIEATCRGRSVAGPVWIQPGHAEGSITVHLGYGRRSAGRVGNGAGFDAYSIRAWSTPWFAPGASIRKTGARTRIACTQSHHGMEGRDLVRSATLEHFREHPDFAKHMGGEDPAPEHSLYPPHKYEGHAWGMAVDLNTCVGCNACVLGCQSENNVPVVGKDQVLRGREMHWLRIDRYYEGDLDNPATHSQPVMCMHCEDAPCEPVCPVGATVHSSEGLNDMVYNRCVGTRYCSNNCPYKVRRFNFYLYADFRTPVLKLLRNPDVSVRSRGVMEKCTYCVQRINQARIEAHEQGRDIRDGEIVTACQQACPAEAIVFGDINDPGSRVSKLRAQQVNYGILTDLGTRPRTTYLASVKNPNPDLERA
jgi:molybdopterin-containing oxidoreductase family iron-sulfur binding subunit